MEINVSSSQREAILEAKTLNITFKGQRIEKRGGQVRPLNSFELEMRNKPKKVRGSGQRDRRTG